MMDLLAAILVLLGAFFCFSAALGIVRFPDVMGRLHAATKPQVFGLIIILLGVALALNTWQVWTVAMLVAAFQIVTAPVSAHMVSRTAYRLGLWDAEDALVDELADDLEEAGFPQVHEVDEPGQNPVRQLRWKPVNARDDRPID